MKAYQLTCILAAIAGLPVALLSFALLGESLPGIVGIITGGALFFGGFLGYAVARILKAS